MSCWCEWGIKLTLCSNQQQAKKGDGIGHNIGAILNQLLSIENVRNTTQANENKVHLRFASHGRRTSTKIGTLMAVFHILDEQEYGCDHEYPITLYNGKNSYFYTLHHAF